ncbi:transposase [Sinorhizobium fredii]|uniref:transposase n=1 Tax=Rhizobium fredii TaxID=380 RepID=UPI000AF12524
MTTGIPTADKKPRARWERDPWGYREGKLLPAGHAEDEQGARGSGICPRNRWSRRNLFEALRSISPDDDFHAIDSTTAKAHRAAAGGIGGAETQATGRSRGGRSTKIHAVCDSLGRAIALDVTPGRGDVRVAIPLLTALPPSQSCAADTAYRVAPIPSRARNHPGYSEQPHAHTHPSLRQKRLQTVKPGGTHVLHAQGLAAHRNTL